MSPVLGPASAAKGQMEVGLGLTGGQVPAPTGLVRSRREAILDSMSRGTGHFTFGPQFPHQ